MARISVNPNLVENAGFETLPAFVAPTTADNVWIDGSASGSASDDQYGWALNKSGTVAGQFDTAEKYAGAASLKLSTVDISSFIEVTPVQPTFTAGRIRSHGIPVLPSTSYTLRYRMKTSVVSGDSSHGAYVNVLEYDGASTSVIADRPGTIVKTTTDWTEYTITFTTSANCNFAVPSLRVYGHTGAATLIMDAWFDDLELKPTVATARTAATSRGVVKDYRASLKFGGSDRITFSDIAALRFSGSSASFAAWVKPAAIGVIMNILGKSNGGITEGYRLRISADGKVTFFVAVGGAQERVDTSEILVPHKWYRILATVGPGFARVYLNGNLAPDEEATTGDMTPSTAIFYIGQDLAAANGFNGPIQAVKIWDVELDAAEAIADSNGFDVAPDRVVRDWNLGAGAGTTVTDADANDTGTITGATWSSDTPCRARQLVNGNLVPNGNFEIAPPFVAATTVNDRIVDGNAAGATRGDYGISISEAMKIFRWKMNTYSTTSPAVQYDGVEKHSGSYSMKLSGTDIKERVNLTLAQRNFGDLNDAADIRMTCIPVLPSTEYKFSFWTMVDVQAKTGDPFGQQRVYAAPVEHSGSSYLQQSKVYIDESETDWTYHEVIFTTSANARYINIYVQAGGTASHYWTGALWIDDIDLRPTTPVARLAA